MVPANDIDRQSRKYEIEGDLVRKKEEQFSKLDLETKGFVTVLMYGGMDYYYNKESENVKESERKYGIQFEFKGEDANKANRFVLADQLILVSDRFKNEVIFSE